MHANALEAYTAQGFFYSQGDWGPLAANILPVPPTDRRPQGFFSKFLMEGDLKIFGPRRSPKGMKSGRWNQSGGGDLWKKSDWSQNCPLNAKLGHFLLF